MLWKSKRSYLVKSWEKTGEYTRNLEQVIMSLELNPLLTLPGIQTDLYPTFLFSGIPTNLLCPYVIHVDLIEPFCRFQLNVQLTACCFELHVLGWFLVDFGLIFTINAKNLDCGYSSFRTAKLVNT